MDDDLAAPPAATRRATGAGGRRPRARLLGDDDLADEIELYGAVVAAASAKDGELSPDEIDDVLGVPAARSGAPDERPSDGG